ncbi:CRISPR-associated ring nuclease [Dictyobacter vulcani]|uniref:CRISPR-associated ring nuclease n=1 Tax=Dictyobacter vulcani TaxID=2607529 RepID=UPI0027D979F9|nr:CRISPR-associated ring nuclease [Dictyobacter vulcani]
MADFSSLTLQKRGNSNDIVDDSHADATLETIHQLVVSLKHQGYHIHLSVSGGRRLMSLLAISVAALNFDRHDHIWHIHTPEATVAQVRNGAHMHVPPEAGVKLIRGPFITLGAYIPNSNTSFKTAEQEQQDHLNQQERTRCQQIIELATARQLDVLKAFARGLRTPQVASELCISEATVHSHKGHLIQHCRTIWNIPESEPLDYHFLCQKFSTYFESDR